MGEGGGGGEERKGADRGKSKTEANGWSETGRERGEDALNSTSSIIERFFILETNSNCRNIAGALTLDLNRFPRGAKSSQRCTLDMLKTDGSVPMMSLFKHKRAKGWWPFAVRNEGFEELELTVSMM